MGEGVITGWAHGRFGSHPAPGFDGMIAEVAPAALAHAGIGAEAVDAVFLGTFGGFVPQSFEAGLVGMVVPGLAAVPALRCENACATGSAAVFAALDFVAAGQGRVALVIGAEKMRGVPAAEAGRIMLRAAHGSEQAGRQSFAGVFAGVAERYFMRHGERRRELAMIAAKNLRNGMANPWGHLHQDPGVEFCATESDANPRVAGCLLRSDCAPISDGAAALVIVCASRADEFPRAVGFRGRGRGSDLMALGLRPDPLEFAGARRAWAMALAEAGVAVGDLSLIETHDCFTIAELIEYEALGLADPGEGWRVVREGRAERGGALPVNPSGGLKARGHPLGATGVSQHVMAAMQLCGEAGGMQVPGAVLAGVFNMGGVAVANYAAVLERVR
jgi:acetyl-CoA C-acetyltransferase